MQRCFAQDSLKVGFSAAVSVLAFTTRDLPGIWKPHFIGNTACFPSLLGAITGTTFVGRISPDVRIAFPALMNFPESMDF